MTSPVSNFLTQARAARAHFEALPLNRKRVVVAGAVGIVTVALGLFAWLAQDLPLRLAGGLLVAAVFLRLALPRLVEATLRSTHLSVMGRASRFLFKK